MLNIGGGDPVIYPGRSTLVSLIAELDGIDFIFTVKIHRCHVTENTKRHVYKAVRSHTLAVMSCAFGAISIIRFGVGLLISKLPALKYNVYDPGGTEMTLLENSYPTYSDGKALENPKVITKEH